MTIPLPMLWQATLPRVQKAALAVCFSGGLFVTMAGILRCVYIITVSSHRHNMILLCPPPPAQTPP